MKDSPNFTKEELSNFKELVANLSITEREKSLRYPKYKAFKRFTAVQAEIEEFEEEIEFLIKQPPANKLAEVVIESLTNKMNLVADDIIGHLAKLPNLNQDLKKNAASKALNLKEITGDFKIDRFKTSSDGLGLFSESIEMAHLLQEEIEKAEEEKAAAIVIQKSYREHLESKKLTKPEEENSAAIVIQKSYREHLKSKKVTKPEEELRGLDQEQTSIDDCLRGAIRLMEISSGDKIDLSKNTFKNSNQDQPVLDKEQINQLASVDPARLSYSRYGGLTFDFKEANSEDVKKFLQSVYCADFRSCKIINLDLKKVFEGTGEEEKNKILKNFATVKFTNCKFEECQFEGFRFRVENIEGTSGATNILPPSTSPREIKEIKQAFGLGPNLASLVSRGG
jgi:hypothetical protein